MRPLNCSKTLLWILSINLRDIGSTNFLERCRNCTERFDFYMIDLLESFFMHVTVKFLNIAKVYIVFC